MVMLELEIFEVEVEVEEVLESLLELQVQQDKVILEGFDSPQVLILLEVDEEEQEQ